MKALNKQTLSIFLSAALIASSVGVTSGIVSSLSIACQNSPECLEAIEREKEATAKAEEAQATADEYQNKVQQLSLEIASLNAEIAESEAYANELKQQIEETQAKLDEQQTALADLLVQIHFETKAEPITLLAGARSLSDYAEKQARINTIKNQIGISAQNIKEAKEQLEHDKETVEAIIESQKVMKEAVAAHQAEQQQLVENTRVTPPPTVKTLRPPVRRSKPPWKNTPASTQKFTATAALSTLATTPIAGRLTVRIIKTPTPPPLTVLTSAATSVSA